MTDTFYSFIITGVIAVVVLWLVFFVVRKLIGFALLVTLAIGVWAVWNDPVLLQEWAYALMGFFSSYI
ncbi:glucose dehydrogenase [Pseudorhizobium tarimense]|uniref:Glucose dehydrogenase n=1 Tax=Pseudorhizobium tarimense TaxID=1079109 RepID=A0ABV2HD62_9HYPH|nr:hypothetical protein [Pseudorhizobium tarimense]MCJ8521542.1 hypothetical protein [Pseudorhizobium tarimense]